MKNNKEFTNPGSVFPFHFVSPIAVDIAIGLPVSEIWPDAKPTQEEAA